MDTLDSKVLAALTKHGRMTWADLAQILGLSAPATADRVRQLEAEGVIQGFTAILSPEALGFEVLAFIFVTLDRPHQREAFLARVVEIPEVQACHHLAGDDDYLLKVRCLNTRHLDWLLGQLKLSDGVTRTRTTIALSSSKETTALPLPQDLDYCKQRK